MFFKKNKIQNQPKKTVQQEAVELIKTLLVAVPLAILLRTFLFEPFNVPSGSMYPNLMVGDFLFVSKWPWGYSKYAYPFSPNLYEGRILDFKRPKRGDVIVFKFPGDLSFQYVKRAVGIPGDRVQMKAGVLHINGEAVKLERIEDYTYTEAGELHDRVPQYLETFPDGHQHRILKERSFGVSRFDDTPEYVVPEKHYFAVGDNRDNSWDSRDLNFLGFVHEDYLLGPADLIYFSTEKPWWPSFERKPFALGDFFTWDVIWWQPWEWLARIRYSRFFNSIV